MKHIADIITSEKSLLNGITDSSSFAKAISELHTEKILKMTWFASDEAFMRFSKKLRRLGIDDKLKEMGIKEGDTIRILDYEFEYKD